VARLDRFTSGLTDARKLESVKSNQSLNAVITDVLTYGAGQGRFKDIETEVELASDLPTLSMDADQMGQLLLNLLNNAADAIRAAGHLPGRIRLETRRVQDGVQLVVIDNGGGIDPDVRARLFKSRFTTKPSGHGYGLVTCARIVQSHDGVIEVESEVGKGARFTVTLPVSDRVSPVPVD
jgi:signal transduction histidine kinase